MTDPQLNGHKYAVVVNDEEQYSIWSTDMEIPAGWRAVGVTGSEDECLDHIERVWVDMRPLSVRRHLEKLSATRVKSDDESTRE